MRVGLVCGQFRPELDGVAGYVGRLAEELSAYGVDPVIVSCGPDSASTRSIRIADRWNLRGTIAAGRVLANLDLDAVHVQVAPSMYGFNGAVGLLPLALRRPVPLLSTLHEYGSWELPIGRGRALRRLWPRLEGHLLMDRETGFLVPRSAAVVVTNPVHRSAVEQRFSGRITARHIPIGANVEVAADMGRDEARSQVRKQLGLGPHTALLSFFGFVHPVKGIRYLLEALSMVRAEGEDAHLLVIGGFESLALPRQEAHDFRMELQGRVHALGLEGQVTFTGFQSAAEVSRWLLACDAGVLPFTAGVTSKSGSFLTMLAHGLPVVVTAAEDESLTDGLTCVAVGPVRDSGALADGLRRVLRDRSLRARISRHGKALADQRSWQGIARQHADLYREACG